MKTERRHELQTNELADWLGAKIEALKPYSRAILGGVIAVAVIVGVITYLSRQRAATQAEGWDLYFLALQKLGDTPEEMSELAQSPTYRETAAGLWARIALADYNYAMGQGRLTSNRAQAKQELTVALDNYSSVASQRDYPELAERALLGKARTLESLDELDDARKAYEELQRTGDGPYQQEAERRLADLSRESTQRFYDWFAQQDARPRSSLPGFPGIPPEFNLDSLSPDASLQDRTSSPDGTSSGTPAKSDSSPAAGPELPLVPEAPKGSPSASSSDAPTKPATPDSTPTSPDNKPATPDNKPAGDAAKQPPPAAPASPPKGKE